MSDGDVMVMEMAVNLDTEFLELIKYQKLNRWVCGQHQRRDDTFVQRPNTFVAYDSKQRSKETSRFCSTFRV